MASIRRDDLPGQPLHLGHALLGHQPQVRHVTAKRALRGGKVRLQAGPSGMRPHGETVVHHEGGRPAREQRVAVTALTTRTADDRVHTETIGEPLGLVDVPASTQRKIDFLQRHEVRLLGLDHPKDGVKVVAVPSKAAVDVVGHDAEIHGHLP